MNSNFGHFSWVDFTIIIIVILSTVISFFRGFIREAISLVIWITAIIIPFKFSDTIQIYFQTWIKSYVLRHLLTFGALFLSVFICGIFINLILHILVRKAGLTIADRFLGIFFGAARGLLIVAILLIFVSVGDMKMGTVIAQSRLASKFQPIIIKLNQFLPCQLKNIFGWIVKPPVRVNKGNI